MDRPLKVAPARAHAVKAAAVKPMAAKQKPAPTSVPGLRTPRRVGRPRADAVDGSTAGLNTREAILAAARAEFADQGLSGARVNRIADVAGVNKQLIYYYYGNKEGLYQASLESVYLEIREMERALNLADLSPPEAMGALVGFCFDYLARHPEFIGMLTHENARGASHARGSAVIRESGSPMIELISRTLRRGVRSRDFASGIDPVHLYISIAGLSWFYFSNRGTLGSLFGRDLGSAASKKAYRAHVVAFALAALRRA